MPYTAKNIKELNTSTPAEGASYLPELNDSDREIKTAIKNQYAIISVTNNLTLDYSHSIVLGSGNITITLPAASSVAGSGYTKHYWIKNIGSGTITLSGSVDGKSNPTISAGKTMHIFSDGTSWYKQKDEIYEHADTHEAGGDDEISVEGLAGKLLDPQKVSVQAGGSAVGQRTAINFIQGNNIELSVSDDSVNQRVNVEISGRGTDIALDTIPSSTIRHEANALRVVMTTPTLLKEFKCNEAVGNIRLYLTGQANTNDSINVTIYKNDQVIGSLSFNEVETTKYADLFTTFANGDYIRVYAYADTPGGYIKNCKLAYNLSIKSIGGITLLSTILVSRDALNISVTKD